jgi:hypothetical protein
MQSMADVNRREFVSATAALAVAASAATRDVASRVCLFTDHLAGFEYKEVASMLRELRVTGPDLTVRPGGLVVPERVVGDLPKAAAAMKDQGLTIPMITTGITSAGDAQTRLILETAARLGIRYYKLGYFPYSDLSQWEQTIASVRRELQGLATLGKRVGIRGGMHNHSGNSVGCALWDSWEALEGVDRNQIGFYFDPAQATIEGGKNRLEPWVPAPFPAAGHGSDQRFHLGKRHRGLAHPLGAFGRRHGSVADVLRNAAGGAVGRADVTSHRIRSGRLDKSGAVR